MRTPRDTGRFGFGDMEDVDELGRPKAPEASKEAVRVADKRALEDLRDAVAGAQAAGGERISFERMVTLGIKLARRRLQRRFNGGRKFERRTGGLKPGRRPR